MAYKNIKGIVVEIGGDTSGLQNALKKVYSQTSSLQKELRGINSLLKLDPHNTTLLSQKQKVLKEDIKATKTQLEGLKQAQKEYIASGGDLNTPKYRELQREIEQCKIKLKEMGTEASIFTRMGNNLNELSSKMRGVGDKFQEIGGKIESVGKAASVASTAVAAMLTAGVKQNADIESSTAAFETFLGSAEAANKAVAEIRKQSAKSPFDTKDLLKANQMLVTTGVNADDARETINALGNAIALTGGGNDELTRMASNLQQIKNAGKATSMDIRQFAYAGIDVYGILAETTGKNVDQLKKMDITYEELSNALRVASKEGGKYFGGQEKMANTLNGQVNTLKKTFMDLLGEITQSLMPTIKKMADGLQGLIDKFRALSPEQKETIAKIAVLVAALGPALIVIGKIVSAMGTIIHVGSAIVWLVGYIASGIGGLSGALTVLTGPIGIIIAVCTALVGIFINLWQNSENFRNSIIAIGENIATTFNEHIKPALDDLIAIVTMLWNDVLMPLINWIMTTFGPVFEQIFIGVGKVVSTIFQSIGETIHGITGIFRGLIDFIAGVFTGDWERAWKGVQEIFGGIFNGLKGLVVTPLNWIIDRINDFIWGVNQIKIPDGIPGVGGVGFNFGYLNKIALAKGGIVTGPTNALIGEGRSAEAVIPLDRTLSKYMAEAMKQAGGVGGITVNFYPQKMTDAELDNAFNYINRKFGLAY